MQRAISLKDVWLRYRIEFKENDRFIPEDFWPLKGINIDVDRGEAISIIGENGAGKTTLLKVIAGMLRPDKGVVQVHGSVSALLEIGAGFEKDLTGKENIHLISSFFGLAREEIEARYNDIVKFASIGRFINAPVKSYSQGMYMRLAFAIAIHVDPDILLVDDMFVVGDLYAQHKCINKMFELKERGKTIIFVTHDLETAKRFCQRGVFLKDGRVVKDDLLMEVASFYLKTVGDKKGIGIVEGTHIGLIFNNGKLVLSWDNDSLTKEWGGQASMLSNGRWHSSLKADWELKESNKDGFLVEGRFWDLPITQLWHVRLNDTENEIDLKIETIIRENFNLQESIISFMFREDYKHWFNPCDKEPFETNDFSNEFTWKYVNSEEPTVDFVGLSAQGDSEALLPSVVLKDDIYVRGKLLEVKNTDHTFKARVLQSRIIYHNASGKNAKAGRHSHFRTKIRIIKDPSAEDSFRRAAPRTMMPKEIVNNKNLSLSVDDYNKISLYWGKREVTSSKGFKTKFHYNDKLYQSSDAAWEIHRISCNRLDIAMQWADLPLRQIWNIELQGDNVLLWKVYMEVSERAIIRNNKFSIMFSPEYTEWVNSDEEGEITEELKTENFKNIVMRNDPYGIIGLKGRNNDLKLPFVLLHDNSSYAKFNSLEKKDDPNINLSDVYSNEPVVNLHFFSIDSKESFSFKKGSYLVYDASLLIGDGFQQKEYIENIKKNKSRMSSSLKKRTLCASDLAIENGQYGFKFIKGSGRLFFKGREITKNFGIYTSLYSREFDKSGLWYSSLDAIWEVLSVKRKRLLVKSKWPYLPLAQIWEIKVKGDGFTWRVDMEAFAETVIERQQAYLMLSDTYDKWGTSGRQSGFFPEEFALLRWDGLYRSRAIDRLHISAKQDNILPSFNLSCLKEANNFEAVVENSNVTFKSRILGFERIIDRDNQKLEPGLYKYFHGDISFE